MSGNQDPLQVLESYFSFRDFLDAYVQGTILLDDQQRIQYIDKAGAGLFGYEPSALENQPVRSLFPDWPVADVVESPSIRQQGKKKDGSLLALIITPKPLERSQSGQNLLLLLHHQQGPVQGLDLYEFIFDRQANGILIIKAAGQQVLLTNSRFRIMMELPPATGARAQQLSDFCPPLVQDENKPIGDHLTEIQQEGHGVFECQLVTQTGRLLYAEMTGTLLPFFEEDLILLVTRDITYRKLAENQLMESRRTLEAVIKSAVDGIIIIDERGMIQLVNEAALELFGYEKKDLIGENINALMPEPHHSNHDEYLRQYRRTGKAQIIGTGREVNGRRKDGTTFPFRLGVSEVNLGNKKLFAGVIHDLTEQKAAEAKVLRLNKELENKVEERTEKLTEVVNKLLQANLRLEYEVKERKAAEKALLHSESELRKLLEREKELSELKSRFVSMASHEFRTPLTTIASSTELLGLYTQSSQQEKREKHLKRIQAAVTNLTGILGDFLSLSRLEEGKIEIQREQFYLQELCDEVTEQLQGMLKSGQTIETHLHGCDSEMYLDKKMLKNIFINLLSNAIKYSKEDKVIRLHTRIENDELVVSIIDQGIGIPAEDQKHLFTRFFRAHNAGNIQGTGLGLNIVKRYLDLMDGSITFSSEEGKGTTFTFRVPLLSAES